MNKLILFCNSSHNFYRFVFATIILIIVASTFLHWRKIGEDDDQKIRNEVFIEEVVKSFSLISESLDSVYFHGKKYLSHQMPVLSQH